MSGERDLAWEMMLTRISESVRTGDTKRLSEFLGYVATEMGKLVTRAEQAEAKLRAVLAWAIGELNSDSVLQREILALLDGEEPR